jgi:hypothetical protein
MTAPEPLSAEERAHIVGRARRGLLPSNPYEDFESYEATVQAAEAERDALRAYLVKIRARTELRSGPPTPEYAALVHIDHLCTAALGDERHRRRLGEEPTDD